MYFEIEAYIQSQGFVIQRANNFPGEKEKRIKGLQLICLKIVSL